MGFIAHSHAGDDFMSCRDYVASRLGFGPDDWKGQRPATAPKPKSQDEVDREAFIRRMVDKTVRELVPIAGTRGEMYLRDVRKINTGAIVDVLGSVAAIGWHPECLFREEGHSLDGRRLGAIVAVMTDPMTAKPAGGIARSYIGPDGAKVAKAKGLGPAGIVRLTTDEDVLAGLFLAEGLETALDRMAHGARPMWSTGSTSIMSAFPVLAGVEALTIFADNDAEKTRAGERAARQSAQRWRAAGREVIAVMPDAAGDFNDMTMRARS